MTQPACNFLHPEWFEQFFLSKASCHQIPIFITNASVEGGEKKVDVGILSHKLQDVKSQYSRALEALKAAKKLVEELEKCFITMQL